MAINYELLRLDNLEHTCPLRSYINQNYILTLYRVSVSVDQQYETIPGSFTRYLLNFIQLFQIELNRTTNFVFKNYTLLLTCSITRYFCNTYVNLNISFKITNVKEVVLYLFLYIFFLIFLFT